MNMSTSSRGNDWEGWNAAALGFRLHWTLGVFAGTLALAMDVSTMFDVDAAAEIDIGSRAFVSVLTGASVKVPNILLT